MKRNHILTMLGATALAVITISSCSDVLDETPRSSYTLDYFKSEDGVKGGLTQMYSQNVVPMNIPGVWVMVVVMTTS